MSGSWNESSSKRSYEDSGTQTESSYYGSGSGYNSYYGSRRYGSGSGYYGSGYASSNREEELPTYKRIACVRYVRPMVAYDRCGNPFLPPSPYNFQFPNCGGDPYANGCAGEFPPSNRVLVIPPRRNLYRPAANDDLVSGPPTLSYGYSSYDNEYGSSSKKAKSNSYEYTYETESGSGAGSGSYSGSGSSSRRGKSGPKSILRK